MANRIRTIMADHLRWYREGKYSKDELVQNANTLAELVYQNYREGLISDSTKTSCERVLSDYWREIIKIDAAEKKGV